MEQDMNDSISRRSFLAGTAAAAAAAAASPLAAQGRTGSLRMRPSDPPISTLLPNTRYFEVTSAVAGARYAIWVTTPAGYERAAGMRFPVLYLPDGNGAAPSFIPRTPYLQVDPINPIQPFIMVCVGYPAEDAPRALAVRARDLLPPGEPLPPGVEQAMDATVQAGLLDRAGADLYLRNLRNPAGDKFLSFLLDELHPAVSAAYRVDDSNGAGLFGFSYGGLFAAYAALRRTPLFRRIGAGSPGILPGQSRLFKMYREEAASGADYSGRLLHMTLCERELTYPSSYQPLVAAGTAEFITLAGTQPLKGLSFSSKIIPEESHITGSAPSFASFLRTAYGGRPRP
jgi:predicted alpha/beta superfamily hydrolase